MSFTVPDTLEAALTALARPGAVALAGGTDWFPRMGEGAVGAALVDLRRVPGMVGISRGPEGWRIGAATPWATIARADLPPAFDGLRAAARVVGSVQIQNVGTVGGNLCNASPAADGVPPLLALGARVELAGRGGARTLGLDDFLRGPRQTALDPGEALVAVHVPDPGPGWRGAFAKAGGRDYLVISIAMVGALFRVSAGRIAGARIAVGACGPVARRLTALEGALVGAPPGQVTVVPGDLGALTPIDDLRADAAYRLQAVAVLLTRMIRGLA